MRLRLETTLWLMMIPLYALELSYFMCSGALLRVSFSHRINSTIILRTPNQNGQSVYAPHAGRV